MRITNQMVNNNLLKNINRHQVDMDEVQNQISTGQKIRRPSDDPGLATNQIAFRSRLYELNQYQKNMDDSKSRLDMIDGNLDRVTDILQRLRELTVQAANGTYQGDKGFELDVAIGKEVDELLKGLVEIANGRDATGQPLFGGHIIERLPFEAIGVSNKGLKGIEVHDKIASVTYKGDIGEQLREIERGEYLQVSIPGNRVFWGTNMNITSSVDSSNFRSESNQKFKIDGAEIHVAAGDSIDDVIDKINNAGIEVRASKLGSDNISLSTTQPHQIWLEDVEGGNVLKDIGLLDASKPEPNNYSSTAVVTGHSLFDVVIQLRNDLTSRDQEKISGRDIQNIDSALENILKHRSIVGARTNRLEEHAKRVEFDKSYMTEMLANNEGIDYAETIMNLKWLESVHSYALSIGSKIIKPTLMDFLR